MAASLAVSPSAKALLRAGGFRTLQDLVAVAPVQLARELGMDGKKVFELVEEIKRAAAGASGRSPGSASSGGPIVRNALAMLEESERCSAQVVTYGKAIDQLLGGGVPVGLLTELCGVPGAGKTQLCMQLAVDVTIPKVFGGLEGEVLYIDSEGSFVVERVVDMAGAVLRSLRRISKSSRGDPMLQAQQHKALELYCSEEYVLSKMHYCRVHNHAEQVAVVMTLHNFLREHPTVKLLVLDSVAFHFRQEFADMSLRTRLLSSHAQKLNAVAAQQPLAVVVANQMTVRFGAAKGSAARSSADAYFAPALGEAWSHAVTNRIIVERTDETCNVPPNQRGNAPAKVYVRTARLVKSPYLKQGVASFIVTKSGIRDVPEPQLSRP